MHTLDFAQEITSGQLTAWPVPQPESNDMMRLLSLTGFLGRRWLIWGQRERSQQPGRPGLGGAQPMLGEGGWSGCQTAATKLPGRLCGLWTTEPKEMSSPRIAAQQLRLEPPSSLDLNFDRDVDRQSWLVQGPCKPPGAALGEQSRSQTPIRPARALAPSSGLPTAWWCPPVGEVL